MGGEIISESTPELAHHLDLGLLALLLHCKPRNCQAVGRFPREICVLIFFYYRSWMSTRGLIRDQITVLLHLQKLLDAESNKSSAVT